MKLRIIDEDLYLDEKSGAILSLDDLVSPEQKAIVDMTKLFLDSLTSDEYRSHKIIKEIYQMQLLNNKTEGAAFLKHIMKLYDAKLQKRLN